MPIVIFDTDFLSSFLKIERLDLIQAFYGVETAWIPPAVYREITQTDLLTYLVGNPWIQVVAPDTATHDDLMNDEDFQGLGAGEREGIALALGHHDAILLMSDNKARRIATRAGAAVVNIPAFLLACKMGGMVDRNALDTIVQSLWDKDYYQFRQDVLELLLD